MFRRKRKPPDSVFVHTDDCKLAPIEPDLQPPGPISGVDLGDERASAPSRCGPRHSSTTGPDSIRTIPRPPSTCHSANTSPRPTPPCSRSCSRQARHGRGLLVGDVRRLRRLLAGSSTPLNVRGPADGWSPSDPPVPCRSGPPSCRREPRPPQSPAPWGSVPRGTPALWGRHLSWSKDLSFRTPRADTRKVGHRWMRVGGTNGTREDDPLPL
jgi:hypothetical protein